ncbi:MAG: hypothetical protein JWL83_4829, partial [Actinomycetia bacterium]|nr:hypothetical protein [Actinomycetes bacterium]
MDTAISFRGLKGLLLFFMAIGAAAYFGGSGTFASFSAETTNTGGAVSSGTLTMSDQVNTGSACLTANAVTQNNVNGACGAVLALTNVAPGAFGGIAQVAIQNTGSLDASKFYFWAPPVNATLSAGLSLGVAPPSLAVTPLEGTVASGDAIVVSYGTHTQTFAASAAASGGSTAISVASQAADFSYPAGTIVTDTSSNTGSNNTDCYDKTTTTPGTPSATKGSDLNFNPIAGNPFCNTALIYVQETTGNRNYCWLGKGTGSATGMCVAPISVNLTSALTMTGPILSLPVAGLNGNVSSGDSIVVTSGSNTQTFTASASAYIGATAIAVNSLTPNFAYPTTSVVTDASTLASLNADTTDTIRNFDTAHNTIGKIQLFPVTA